jgi:phosphatidylserine/phosphatidylglycerophosphate/cardiolipin synthase-like enzyme
MLLIRSLLSQIFKQLTVINPADKPDEECREVIINARKNVEVRQVTENNFGIMGKQQMSRVSDSGRIRIPCSLGAGFKRRRNTQKKAKPCHVNTGKSQQTDQPSPIKRRDGKTYSQMTQGIPREELDQRRSANECQKCT